MKTQTQTTDTRRDDNAWLRAVLGTIAQAVDDQRADGLDRLGWIRDTAAAAALGGEGHPLGGDRPGTPPMTDGRDEGWWWAQDMSEQHGPLPARVSSYKGELQVQMFGWEYAIPLTRCTDLQWRGRAVPSAPPARPPHDAPSPLGGDDVTLVFRDGRERRVRIAELEQLMDGKILSGALTYQPQAVFPAHAGVESEASAVFGLGARRLLEISAGDDARSRFSVCYWMDDGWRMDDAPANKDGVEERGYRVLAVYELPRRRSEAPAHPPHDTPAPQASAALGGAVTYQPQEGQQ